MVGARLFTTVPRKRRKCNGNKLKHIKFHTNMSKNVFKSASLKIFSTYLDAFLCELL